MRRRLRAPGAGLEHVVADPVEAIENARAAEPGRAQLVAQPARDAVADRTAVARTARACARRNRARRGPSRARSSAAHRATRRRRDARRQISSGTYNRPRDQSMARSCQKLVSCSAVHTASDAAIEPVVAISAEPQHQAADRVCRSPAVVEHVGPGRISRRRRRPARRRSADRRTAGIGSEKRSMVSCSARKMASGLRASLSSKRSRAQSMKLARQSLSSRKRSPAGSRVRRRSHPQCARTRRSPRRAAAASPAADATPPGKFS